MNTSQKYKLLIVDKKTSLLVVEVFNQKTVCIITEED